MYYYYHYYYYHHHHYHNYYYSVVIAVACINSGRECDAVHGAGSAGTGRPVCRRVRYITYHHCQETRRRSLIFMPVKWDISHK